MIINKIADHYKLFITSVGVLVFGVMYREQLGFLYNKYMNPGFDGAYVFSAKELAKYNGISNKKMYLAVLGTVFDVTQGSKYYTEGSSYHYFVGKDGSRALVTGQFNDESKNKDHILDLKCSDIFNLLQWKNTFADKYKKLGVLHGRYYDKKGQETAYSKELGQRVEKCIQEKKQQRLDEMKHPPCNVEWNADEGTKVWCTRTSGGVSRNWVGVPRQLFTPGQEPKCVCVNLDNQTSTAQFKQYDSCPEKATSCNVKFEEKKSF